MSSVQQPDAWQSPEAILELHGRIHVLEHLLCQLLYQGLKHPAIKEQLALGMGKLEQTLQDEIRLADGDRKRVIEHALQAHRNILAALMLNLADYGLNPN